MKRSWIFLIFTCSLFLFQCDKNNEKVPAYLYIDSVSLITLTGQGNTIHQIDGIEVFVNKQLIGNFPLPCKIPVLHFGNNPISISALIRENGSNSIFRKLNGILTLDTTLNFEAQKPTKLSNVIFKYRQNTEFVWIEDFEDNNSTLIPTTGNAKTDTSYIITDWFNLNNRFSKNSKVLYAEVKDSDTSKYFDLRTFNYFKNLPINATIVTVEFDIKSNSEVQFGYQRKNNTGEVYEPYLGLKSTNNTWKRIYCNFTYATASKPVESEYKMVFSMYKREDDNFDSKVYFDNFKITYLKD